MRKTLLALAAVACAAGALSRSPRAGLQPDGSYLVPTGQRLTPAGTRVEVADRPLGMVASPAGDLLAVTTGSNFAPRSLHLIDIRGKAAPQSIAIGDSFVGVAFDATGATIYIGGGPANDGNILARDAGGELGRSASIAIPGGAPSGLALSPDGRTLYAALNLKHAVAMIDLATKKIREVEVGSYPYTVAVARGKVYVSNWGGRRPAPDDTTDGSFPVVLDPRTGIPASGTVSVLDPAQAKVVRHIDVGLHPSGMAVSPSGD